MMKGLIDFLTGDSLQAKVILIENIRECMFAEKSFIKLNYILYTNSTLNHRHRDISSNKFFW